MWKNEIINFGRKIYGLICGELPSNYNLFHFRWLALKYINADLKRILPKLKGKVLDVGCDGKPYERWLKNTGEYIGIDIYSGSKVDYIISPSKPWPLSDSYFDSVICTQVLEHVEDFNNVVNEIYRVLKPGGLLIVTLPFIYNEHGAPNDYRRFSVDGVKQIFEKSFQITELKKEGGIGSSLAVLFLNFLALYSLTRIIMGIFLPVWILLCAVVNISGFVINKFDTTGFFYSSVMIIAKKRRLRNDGGNQ